MATQAELRAAMDRHKGKLRNLMEVMENALGADPFPKYLLRRKLGNAETSWNEVENYYVPVSSLTGAGPWEVCCQGPQEGCKLLWTPPMVPVCTRCRTSPPFYYYYLGRSWPWKMRCQGPPECDTILWWTPPMEPVCPRCRDLFDY